MSSDILSKKDAAKRILLEKDFLSFLRWNFKQVTKQSFSLNDHHVVLANAFQKVLDGKTKNLGIFIPPRYSKTEMVKQFCCAGFARNPESQFIYTSYSDTLALKCSKEIKDAITHDAFSKLWGINIKTDTKSKKLWETVSGEGVGGGFYATSFGGAITGFGAGKMEEYKSQTQYNFNGAIIIDDPLKAQDRHRKIAREDCIDYYTGTLSSRFNNPSETPCILIMQRLHPEDLAGWIMDNEGDDWDFITLSAIKEDGEPLWPAMHSLADLEKLAKRNEMFTSQYLQQPIKLGGNLIKPTQFKTYIDLPFLKRRFITADTALKDKEHNDYSVFQCWGVGHDNLLYLIDQWRGKIESKDLKQRFIAFWNKHLQMFNEKQYGYLTTAYVEDKSSGTQLIQEVKAEGRIPVRDIQRHKSKLQRVLDILLPKMASGYIYVPAEAPWLQDFFTECEDFHPEMSHKHDDQIDPMVDAVEITYKDIVDSSEVINNNIERKRIANRRLARRKRR